MVTPSTELKESEIKFVFGFNDAGEQKVKAKWNRNTDMDRE